MSQKRLCDADGTIINPEVDEFYVVTSGRDGTTKDLCNRCIRSPLIPVWTPGEALERLDRVKPTAGQPYPAVVFDVLEDGVTGTVEPAWPTTVGAQVVDGTVTFLASAGPTGKAVVYRQLPGEPALKDLSMWGWLTDRDELF